MITAFLLSARASPTISLMIWMATLSILLHRGLIRMVDQLGCVHVVALISSGLVLSLYTGECSRLV